MIAIAPSILSADFARLADALEMLESAGADMVHVDVMDGRFVPNLTIGPPVVAALRRATRLPLDCHLMVEEPHRLLGAFVDAGADRIAVHVETGVHLHRTVAGIRDAGISPGVAINPATPVGSLEEIIGAIDFVLLMSVNPGFGGQRFIRSSVGKVERLRALLDARDLELEIQVDGGVNSETIAPLVRAGARNVVAGKAVFGADDPAAAVGELRARGLAAC